MRLFRRYRNSQRLQAVIAGNSRRAIAQDGVNKIPDLFEVRVSESP
jgi:hypothetical protein